MPINKFYQMSNQTIRKETFPSQCVRNCLKSKIKTPTEDNDIANKEYVDTEMEKVKVFVDTETKNNKEYVDTVMEKVKVNNELIIDKFNEISSKQNIQIGEVEDSISNVQAKVEELTHFAYPSFFISSLESGSYGVYLQGGGYPCFGNGKIKKIHLIISPSFTKQYTPWKVIMHLKINDINVKNLQFTNEKLYIDIDVPFQENNLINFYTVDAPDAVKPSANLYWKMEYDASSN